MKLRGRTSHADNLGLRKCGKPPGKNHSKGVKIAMKPNVTTIPATLTLQRENISDTTKKRRTAAYARVSTDSEEQEQSYNSQCEYYTKYINDRPDWQFVSVYSDEGISAVNTKKRDGFNQMISDALAGKIDLIITKSVSRFARTQSIV